jgi:hypothetical protein
MISPIKGVEVRSIMGIKFRPKSKKVKTFLDFGLNSGTAEAWAGSYAAEGIETLMAESM